MPATHILIDTNTYLRLAKTIRPFLGQTFADPPYLLSVIPELNLELINNRLQTMFNWVAELEHKMERSFYPKLSRANKKGIINTFEFLWDHVTSALPGPSRVDTIYIAYALELDCLLVTDDQNMQQLAKVFGVKSLSTLELLQLMLEHSHITLQTITSLVNYWKYNKDLPANFHKDYLRLFGHLGK